MLIRFAVVLACLAALSVAAPARAEQPPLDATQKREAARALDRRVGCAAFYRITYELLSGDRASERTRELAATYDVAGRDLLVQAGEIAGALGEGDAMLNVRFKTALAALSEEIDGRSVAYNRYAARFHPVCGRLIRQ